MKRNILGIQYRGVDLACGTISFKDKKKKKIQPEEFTYVISYNITAPFEFVNINKTDCSGDVTMRQILLRL